MAKDNEQDVQAAGRQKRKAKRKASEVNVVDEEGLVEATEPKRSKKWKAAATAALEAEQGEEAEDLVKLKPNIGRLRKRPTAAEADADGRHDEEDDEEDVAEGSAGGGAETSSTPRASKPSALFKKDVSFASLGLSRGLVDNCQKLGMQYPTEIQAMSIPQILQNKNVAGNAQTGSGKTACYCLPILHSLSQDPYGVFALVLVPVRELAFQVSDNFRALGKSIGVTVVEVVGGRDMMTQSRLMAERTHVVVATPGRLADLLRGDPSLKHAFRALKVFVLDEADQLLTQTFEEPLAEIIGAMPKSRQTLLFSATLTKSIEKLTARILGLVVVDANPRDETLDNLTQEYVFVPHTVQICYLHYLLASHFADSSCIVFTPTIELCQLLITMLEVLDFPVTGLHALQLQRKRQASLGKFRAGRCSILVATDVACRGLDIPKVSVVINFGLPSHADNYVHRAGRTARAGRPGLVVSLMSEKDVGKVHLIEERIGKPLELRSTSEVEALKLLSKTTKARQRAELLLSEIGFEDQVLEHRQARKNNNNKKGANAS
mmetsp:Transcript_30393/g.87044  ORF Transcript_30393/g.87044 Transcript_30393/m.87044 type:complete len:548 (-) Transcript_30393:238-1881(-)